MNSIVRKSNDLNEAQYSFNIWETRLFVKLLTMINRDDKEFAEYKIHLGDFIKELGIESNKNAYTLIKEAGENLLTKIVVVDQKLKDGTTERLKTPIIIGYKHNVDTNSYLKLSFHPDLKRDLLDLAERYLTYDIRNVLNLGSPVSVRLYELTKQYEKIGKRTILVEELRAILNLENKYPKFYHLKKQVLEPSMAMVNEHTDINISFSEFKKGRSTYKLEFLITKKEEEKEKETKVQVSKDELAQTLADYGVNLSVQKSWREKYSNEHIVKRIEYMNRVGEGIKNKAAYLNSIMDKELKKSKKNIDVTKKVNAILFSRPNLQKQIEVRHGSLSQEALNAVVVKMFPDKF